MPRPSTLACALSAALLSASVAASPGRDEAPSRVMTVLDDIGRTLRATRYSHSTRIDARAGRYELDCSALAGYVLARAAPSARAALARPRPVAVDFYRVIRDAPTARPRNGWQRLARIADARPGDVFAWPRPSWFPSHNTGHVGFVVDAPVVTSRGVLLRIADSTSLPHADDTRDAQRGQSGIGRGTLLVATDPATGEGTAYGWYGDQTPTQWLIPTTVVVGRVSR